jgi:hypothetical protein
VTATETILASRPLLLLRDGGSLREGVARRHGRRWNWARTTPRTTPTNTAHKHPQAWCEKVGRSIKGSDTPHQQTITCRRECPAIATHTSIRRHPT